MIPKALSLDRMVIVALFGVPSTTPLEELWEEVHSITQYLHLCP